MSSLKHAIRIAGLAAAAAVLLTQFNNCADPLPDLSDAQNSAVSLPDPNAVVLTVQPQTIAVNQTAQISVSGGTGPYIFTATAGTATVTTEGLITGLATGAATIEVNDSLGHFAAISVSVAAPGPASCVTAYGQTLPDGAQVSVYPAAIVDCPATCTPQTQTCNAGVMNGTFTGKSASCSVRCRLP
jgi:hypothetical protein